ncbi:hypothetical protein [Polymorphospora rubra]|uniref:Glycosyltransferase RgtA/B/C/D-like domain-containing protein n=1 Tax=Polymorphospora rubra TaxID=338584 RepID=A0A810MS69_9ACTN|nr:hypothetical protein [Polymorphospora rubra]BCJ63504.1 hypothetical protein Prubr_05250 [Polymorphospora rubra]
MTGTAERPAAKSPAALPRLRARVTGTPARLRAGTTEALTYLRDNSGRLARTHWLLLALLAAGLLLRVLVMVGYAPAFWYHGDSHSYLGRAFREVPDVIRPYGYSFLIEALLPFGTTRVVVVLQHLAGLALAAAVYVFLQRKGLSRTVALLATTPLVLDARTVALEHYLLAETLFTVLVTVGLLLLCWRRDNPGWLLCAIAGALFGWAAVTRSIGLVALAVPVLYLLIRRIGWLRLAAFASVVGLVLGGYLTWYHQHHGQYSFGTYGGRFLWARTTTFVDCDRLTLTDAERRLCPTEPLDERRPADRYLWGGARSANHDYAGREYDELFGTFARKAILGQPLDFAEMVVVETGRILRPVPDPADERTVCLTEVWEFPVTEQETRCRPHMAPDNPEYRNYTGLATGNQHPLMEPLHGYSRVATVPATVVGLAFLLVLALALVRPRASTLREHLEPLMFAGLAIGMIVASVGSSVVDPRYSTPSLPLALIGAALAWRRFRAVRSTPTAVTRPAAEPATEPAPTREPQIVAAGADH